MNKIGVVLQGGGALGAFEWGALKSFYEDKSFNPSVITGVSIGAITAAVVAANPGNEIVALNRLKKELTVPGLPTMSLFGNEGMFSLNTKMMFNPLGVTSFYVTNPLYSLLEDLVDLKRLNNSETEVIVTAVNVKTGELKKFSNHDPNGLTYKHIVASASLPPGFPMTEIDGELYWDGGLKSNTPFNPAIEALEKICKQGEGIDLYVIKLFQTCSEKPDNLMDVITRMIEIQFSNGYEQDKKTSQKLKEIHELLFSIYQKEKDNPEYTNIINNPVFQKILNKNIANIFEIEIGLEEDASAANNFSKGQLELRDKAGYQSASKLRNQQVLDSLNLNNKDDLNDLRYKTMC